MKKFLSVVGILVAVIGIVYLTGVGFYSEKFAANTVYGNVNVGNLTLEEAENRVTEEIQSQEITLTENGEEVYKTTVADLEPTFEVEDSLASLYYSQNPNAWYESIFNTTVSAQDAEFNNQIDLNTSAVAEEFNQDEERQPAQNAQISYTEEDGYYVEEGTSGTQVDEELLEDAIIDGIESEDTSVELEEAYVEPEVDTESEVITDTVARIEDVSNTKITLQISGNDVTIPQERIESWIYFDANNQLVIDPEGVANYVAELNAEYGTFDKERQFMSTMQGEVTVPPGILGWGIDSEVETQQIMNDLLAGEDVTREPATYSTGGVPGAENDIGDSYVEIDLTNQTMFLYNQGELILSTDIVSGQIGAETVPGANAVNEMLKDTELKGYNQFSDVHYSTPVNYWIRFDDKAQGIHDATWQGSFGGNVYQTAGSLGCINTPLSAVETIYEYVDYGTPVIVFY